MRLIFVNRFYWPDEPATAQLLADLAVALVRRGHEVSVVSSRPGADGPARQSVDGVEIHRVAMSRLGRSSLVARAVDFTSFLRRARATLLEIARPGDTLIAMTDPPLLGAMVDGVARRRHARCIHWVQDIFPEIAIALAPNAAVRLLAGATRRSRDRAWANAAAIVAPGADMAAHIVETGMPRERVAVIPNWAPAGLAPHGGQSGLRMGSGLRRAWGLEGKFVIAYSGNLGRVHELAPLAELARQLADDPRFSLLIVGDGAGRAPLEAAVRTAGLDNVQFQPAQPRARLAESLAAGDIQAVTLKASCARLVFPSKLYGIAAVGRPVLFIGPGDCEVATITRERGFGLAFAPDRMPAAAAAVRRLAGDPAMRDRHSAAALAFFQAEGNLDHAASAWNKLLTAR